MRVAEPRRRGGYPSGIRARTRVPAPGGLSTSRLPVERLDAVGQAAQARAAGGVGPADAVVGDLDERAIRRGTRTATSTREASRVLGDVRERLGDDVVGGRLDLGRAGARRARRRARPGRGARPASASSAGARPRSVRTAGWMPARELAQLLEARGELLARRLEQRASAARDRPRARLRASRSCQRERDEPLLGAVVEVALEPAPLGVAGLDDAGARRGQLVVRVGVREGQRDELGELGDAGLGARRERPLVRDHDHRAPQVALHHDRRRDRRPRTELAHLRRQVA